MASLALIRPGEHISAVRPLSNGFSVRTRSLVPRKGRGLVVRTEPGGRCPGTGAEAGAVSIVMTNNRPSCLVSCELHANQKLLFPFAVNVSDYSTRARSVPLSVRENAFFLFSKSFRYIIYN